MRSELLASHAPVPDKTSCLSKTSLFWFWTNHPRFSGFFPYRIVSYSEYLGPRVVLQVIEPISFLPIARFHCKVNNFWQMTKLVAWDLRILCANFQLSALLACTWNVVFSIKWAQPRSLFEYSRPPTVSWHLWMPLGSSVQFCMAFDFLFAPGTDSLLLHNRTYLLVFFNDCVFARACTCARACVRVFKHSKNPSQVLVACGDPHQLPPTIMNPSMAETGDDPQDLSRTLFSRLSTAGLEPIMVSIPSFLLAKLLYSSWLSKLWVWYFMRSWKDNIAATLLLDP